MPTIAEAFVDIRASTINLRAGLSGAVSMTQRAVASMRGLLGAVGIGLSFAGIVGAVRGIGRAFLEQEQAVVRLRSALAATGQEINANSASLLREASAIQNVTELSDEFVTQLHATALGLGATADSADDVVKAAIGLSAALGQEVGPEMVRYITLAQQGEFAMLSRYVPALRTATTDAQKFAIVQRFVAQGFTQAQLTATSTTGTLRRLRNAIGDVAEELGGLFFEDLGASGFLNVLVGGLRLARAFVADMRQDIQALISQLQPVMATINALLVRALFTIDRIRGADFGQTAAELEAILSGMAASIRAAVTPPDLPFTGGSSGGGRGIERGIQLERLPLSNIITGRGLAPAEQRLMGRTSPEAEFRRKVLEQMKQILMKVSNPPPVKIQFAD